MEFIKKEDLAKKFNSSIKVFKDIDISNKIVGSLLNKLSNEEDSDNIVKLLNLINNQGVYDLDIKACTYMHLGKKLWFNELSTAEKVFIVAYAAHKAKQIIYITYDITSLTDTTLKLFIKIFYSSPYVNVMYIEDMYTNFYNLMIKEALK